ncbi:FAD:protein FMN transferase [Litchfieldella qijiaojingensis]|uniref:FAD:protein FMN transferase n=1 Tax=Litchfieldella qijiaojingensis TaxID=980347 RepID=A0ABQ2YGB9_9GAMM|nr:FAD:protein FMN transferase [Halomonas qijiaojingensis]GGX83398.1 FAD:protein FMN transferase [Halomonas qijiaojingensis]
MQAKASVITVVFGVLTALMVGCSDADPKLDSPVRMEGEIFGTFYEVTIADPLTRSRAEALEAGLLEELEAVDAAMSTYRDDSELMAFNEAPVGEWQTLSEELIEVLAVSEAVAEASGGAFDVTIGELVNLWSFGPEARPREVPDKGELQARLAKIGPDKLEVDVENLRAQRLSDVFVDLSGVAKGHATDRVASYLDSQDIDHYLVNIGGELLVKGYRDESETPWRIGVEVPDGSRRVAQHVLPLHDMSVATSGGYRNYFEEDGRRYSHTIDPRDGYPIRHNLASVSVLHRSNAWADAWATALLVLGPDEAMALASEHELKVLTLERDGDGWASQASPAFVDYFGKETVVEMKVALPDDMNSDEYKES